MMPLVRRSLAVLIAALLSGVLVAAGIPVPANAAPARALEIFSVTTDDAELCPSVDRCAILQNRPFTVRVRVVDRTGQPATVSKDTTIVLDEKLSDGVGFLVPERSEVIIPRNGSEATFSGLKYTQSGNPTLRASGVQLNSDEITVPIALTAVRGDGKPGTLLDLNDPNCGAGSGVPTSEQPTCGHLVTTGANGPVVMSVGSCEDAGSCLTVGGTRALVVTVNADIQHSPGEYSTVILSCDKVLCGGTGVPKLSVIYTFDNNGDLTERAPACPSKNNIGNFEVCVDYVQSMRSDGDLYLVVLLDHDWRGSM
jgi:hypothetical protein